MNSKLKTFWVNFKNYIVWIVGLIGFAILFVMYMFSDKNGDIPTKPEKPNPNDKPIDENVVIKPEPPYTDHNTDKDNEKELDRIREKRNNS